MLSVIIRNKLFVSHKKKFPYKMDKFITIGILRLLLGGYVMNEMKVEEVEKKKPIWKNKSFWVVGVLIILFFTYFQGAFKDVPEGLAEGYYDNALWVFHELNEAFDENKSPSDDVIEFMSDYNRSMDAYPTDYTQKEIYVNELLVSMLVVVGDIYYFEEGQGLEAKLYETRANLAEVLEVDEDY